MAVLNTTASTRFSRTARGPVKGPQSGQKTWNDIQSQPLMLTDAIGTPIEGGRDQSVETSKYSDTVQYLKKLGNF